MAQPLSAPYCYFTDNNGAPLAGGLVYTYTAGTTNPLASYTDSTGGTPNANPVVLDASGRASIWLSGTYKIVVKDSLGNTIHTDDNITTASSAITSAIDTSFTIVNVTDATKKIAFDASGITAGTTRTLKSPDANDTLVGLVTAQTLTNKTLSTGCVATTQSPADNSTKLATTAYVDAAATTTTATQAQMEAAASTSVAVPPGRQQYHPGHPKAWVVFDGTAGGPTAAAGYNVASITKNATGDFTVNFTTAFSSANYAIVGTVSNTSGNTRVLFVSETNIPTASACRFFTANTSTGAASDCKYTSVAFFGDQ